MRKNFYLLLFCIAIVSGLLISKNTYSQTAGSLSFNVTTTFTGGSWGSKSNFVVWVENASGSFVKTRIRYGNELDHLIQWTSKTASHNVVDAITGSTKTTTPFVYPAIIWTGNDLTGATPYNLLPDGTYSVGMELAWGSSMTAGTGRQFYYATFTKVPSPQTVTPANQTNFTTMTLQWTPATPINVTTSALSSNSYCTGTSVSIPFTIGTGTVYNNNVWTAQLSDANGSFANPLNIGTLNGAAIGPISSIIPSGIAVGSGYRIRVIGSQPSSIGTDNGSDILISNQPLAPVIGTITQPSCSLATGSVVLNGLPSTSWTINPGNISGTGSSTTLSGLTAGTYAFTVSSGCTSAASSNVVINIQPTIPSTPVITSNAYILHSDASSGNQWYNQTGILNGATNQDYTATSNGDYYDIVTLNGCSSDTSNIIQITMAGIPSINNKAIKIYPNPVSDQLIIEPSENYFNTNYVILNSIGQVIFKGKLTKKTVVEISCFTSGIYILKLENGKTFEFKKIIKE